MRWREDRPVSWPLSTASRLTEQRPVFFITVEPAFSKQATEGAPVALTLSHLSHHPPR